MTAFDLRLTIQKLRTSQAEAVREALTMLREQGALQNGALRGVELQHIQLNGMDLRGADLRESDLRMAKLQHADLRHADLRGANLVHADCFGARLKQTRFDHARLLMVNLEATLGLSDAQLSKVACLWGSILGDGSLYDGRFDLPGDQYAAMLRGVDPSDQAARQAFFASAEAQGSKSLAPAPSPDLLNTVKLIRNLRSGEAQDVSRALAELRRRGQLVAGALAWVYLRYAQLEAADLRGADLHSADLGLANLRRADLRDACLIDAQLHKTNLQACLLRGANLTGASLCFARLEGAQGLSDQQLASTARLRGASLTEGRIYDGRFCLAGDLTDAQCMGIDIGSAASLADFYDVSLEDYRRGQASSSLRGVPAVKELKASAPPARLGSGGG